MEYHKNIWHFWYFVEKRNLDSIHPAAILELHQGL